MIFVPTPLPGAFVLELERREDERGYFARTWCAREFAAHGLDPKLAQCSVSFNNHCGTLRGMHYQVAPHAEAKLVRCTRGAIHDVIVDLRPDSPTFKQHFGILLNADNGAQLYLPEGFAHGFLTLADNTEVTYNIAEFFEPTGARGVRYNDPAFDIHWPAAVRVISERDRTYPDYE